MTDEERSAEQHELTRVLLNSIEQMSPIFDAADGIRADLDRRGWSPGAAEDIAHQWLVNVMQHLWSMT